MINVINGGLLIGSVNSAFIPCIFEGETGVSEDNWRHSLFGQTNQTSTNSWIVYSIPLPFNRGGLSLRIASAKIYLNKADGSNFVNELDIFADNSSGARATLVTDGTNQTTTGSKLYAFADVNMASYNKAWLALFITLGTISTFEVTEVLVEYYYA